MNASRIRAFRAPSPVSQQKGFSLIELMIVVAIIAILAMIALPQYQAFSAKSKIAGGLAEVAGGKVGVEAVMAEGGLIANAKPEALGLPVKGSRCDSFDAKFDALGVGALTCELKTDARYGTGTVISLNRNSQGVWTCTSTVTDKSLLPAVCV
ncbi:pilin [Stenotrophomonas sp. ZAC14D1_NAIMI4_6]|uniref:pilin n=1 Tax=Stenotrophomonas maltophilia group TaxID=995085 RepID=UPI0009A2379D|nr:MULTISPECIES: pilin [Stenotrophomonas maltophilia group]AWH37867.1 pilin [Stenotrophomonas sp. ZAC14D1_NAIMI4_6]AWH42000.1 pilin [Stenotrophomonas sp. ZAC14D1_NAIMI4_1]